MILALEAISGPPCVVLAHSSPAYAAVAGRTLRQLGCDVILAKDAPEARRLARMLLADLVVLEDSTAGESVWLVCAKLAQELPNTRILIIASDKTTPQDQNLAEFVGASALVPMTVGVEELVSQLSGRALQEV
jgi:CheY-like chemotaxis protein